MYLRQPRFTYSTCGPLTKIKLRIQRIKETGDFRYIYQNKQDKACFQHDMGYIGFKDLTRNTVSDKILRNKTFNIAKNPKNDIDHHCLASIIASQNKIWVGKSSEFYNRSRKSRLEKNKIEIYSTHNKEKSFVAEISMSSLTFKGEEIVGMFYKQEFQKQIKKSL